MTTVGDGSSETIRTRVPSPGDGRSADRAIPHLRLVPTNADSIPAGGAPARVEHRAASSSYETFRTIGARIRDTRRGSKFTQREVAARASISQAALSNYEHGKRDMPLSILLAIAGALEISATELLAGLPISSTSPN